MHPQLREIVAEMESALARLRRLAAERSVEAWLRRPAEGSWSAAECVAHLNLTSEAFVPLLQDGVRRAREMDGNAPERFRRDFVGWLIWKASNPKGGLRSKTGASFVPTAEQGREALVEAFERFQGEQIACIESADGLPLHRVKITSPFDRRVRYSLYSGFTVVAAHQHRHLGQAERAAGKGS